MTPRLLTTSQAAIYLSKCRKTILRNLHKGKIPGRKIGGDWYVDLQALHPTPEPTQADLTVAKIMKRITGA